MGSISRLDDVEVMKRLLKYFGLTEALNQVNLNKGTSMRDVELKTGDVQGFNNVLLSLINTKGLGGQLAGRNAEQRALVHQWLTYNIQHLLDKSGVSDYILRELDSYLAPCAFLAGHNLTLADPVVFTSLQPVFGDMSFLDKEKYPNLSRWYRLLQEDSTLRNKQKKVVFAQLPLYTSTSAMHHR